MQTIIRMLVLAVFLTLSVRAELEITESGFCYLPIFSNVEYKAVAELPTSSPTDVISYGDNALQFGELWLPSDGSPVSTVTSSKRHPLVVLIHGGCWSNELDVQHTQAMSTALSGAGYAVWAIEYRRTGDEGGGWPNTYADVLAAIGHVSKLAQYPIDTRAVALVGHSDGGHLALLAGAEFSSDTLEIDAVIGLAAISDITQYAAGDNNCQAATALFMGGSALHKPQAYAAATLINKTLHAGSVFIHGTADTIVAANHSSRFAEQVRIVEGAGHFDMIHPGTPAFQVLLKELAKRVN